MINILAYPLLIFGFCLMFLFYFYIQQRKRIRSLSEAFQSVFKVQSVVLSTLDFEEVVKKITNTILTELDYMRLGYVIVVLALVDEEKGVLRRIGISQTKEAEAFLKTYPHPFRTIEIPLTEKRNIGVQALYEGKMMVTSRTADLLYPVVDSEYVTALQKDVGLKTSVVFPVVSRGRKMGVLIFSLKKDEKEVSALEWAVMNNFVGIVGIAVENSVLFQATKVSNIALEQANKKLKQLDKLKDDFVSIASHELRTPMTAIRSYVWMALNKPDIPLSEKMKKYLDRTLISTERLINLVNDMLNVSRIESGRVEISPVSFYVQDLVDDVLAEVGPKAAEKQVKVQSLQVRTPEVFADKDKAHQVLLNLIGNALKFTPANGVVTIGFFTDGKVVEVAVKDSGVGISKEDLPRLFRKFERLDNSYVAAATSGGTGLGLYISRSLVELMGGRIWASSEGMGRGATFSFSLPAATPAVLAQAQKYTRKVEGEAKTLEPVAI